MILNESNKDDLLSKIKSEFDLNKINYTTRGKSTLVVSRSDLDRASKIRNEIDPSYQITIASKA